MRASAMADFVERAKSGKSKLATVAKNAIEPVPFGAELREMIIPASLEKELQEGGYSVTYTTGKGHGAWANIADSDGGSVANGFSENNEDALLQAIRAELIAETGELESVS